MAAVDAAEEEVGGAPAGRAGLEEVVQRSASVEAARSSLDLGDKERDEDGAPHADERIEGSGTQRRMF